MTLIELLIAIVLTGILLSGATRIMNAISETGMHASRDAAVTTSDGLAMTAIARLIRDAEVATDSMPALVGDDSSVELISLCRLPRGWVHRCRVRVVARGADGSVVVETRFDAQVLSASLHMAHATFRYVGDSLPDLKAEWRVVTLPRAVALVDAHDTLIMPIGVGR